ncbi:MAG: HAD family phosphatase [Ruminococcus sp.]|nr:HAD family phosphatase [Ruminococcus sp.]
MIRGAVFDMDGLLIDTEKLYLKYWKQAAADFGYEMKDEHVFAIRSLARKFSIPKLKSFFGEDLPTEEIRARRTELIDADIERNGITVKKGMRELMGYLRERGVRTAVATSTARDRTERYLGKIGAGELFDAVICGDMVSSGKPDPEIYLTAAKALGLAPQECAAFEDSPNGIRAAHAAGCEAIMIPDLTPPEEEIIPLLSAVYPDLWQAREFFEGRI